VFVERVEPQLKNAQQQLMTATTMAMETMADCTFMVRKEENREKRENNNLAQLHSRVPNPHALQPAARPEPVHDET
jgi:hypothetical protein